MKTLVSFLFVIALSIPAFGQEFSFDPPNTDVEVPQYRYIKVVAEQANLLNPDRVKAHVRVAEEQGRKGVGAAKIEIKDENGKTLRFNGIIGIFDYLAARKWEYVDQLLLGGKKQVYHFIFRQRIN